MMHMRNKIMLKLTLDWPLNPDRICGGESRESTASVISPYSSFIASITIRSARIFLSADRSSPSRSGHGPAQKA